MSTTSVPVRETNSDQMPPKKHTRLYEENIWGATS